MTDEELIEAIRVYNERCQEQELRLVALFRELRDNRTGSQRFIQFGNSVKWTAGNTFRQGEEERFSLPNYVFGLSHPIASYDIGQEK